MFNILIYNNEGKFETAIIEDNSVIIDFYFENDGDIYSELYKSKNAILDISPYGKKYIRLNSLITGIQSFSGSENQAITFDANLSKLVSVDTYLETSPISQTLIYPLYLITCIEKSMSQISWNNNPFKSMESLERGSLMFNMSTINDDGEDEISISIPNLKIGYGMFMGTNVNDYMKPIALKGNMNNFKNISTDEIKFIIGYFMMQMVEGENVIDYVVENSPNIVKLTDGSNTYAFQWRNKIIKNVTPSSEGEIQMSEMNLIEMLAIEISNLILEDNFVVSKEEISEAIYEMLSYFIMYMQFSFGGKIEKFIGDLKELENGYGLLSNSKTKKFRGSLERLKNGFNMFGNMLDETNLSSLDSESILHILKTIPQRNNLPEENSSIIDKLMGEGYLTIAINSSIEERDVYFQEIGYTNFEEVDGEFRSKGWLVEWIYNPTSSTFSLRKEEPNEEKKIYTKVVEIKDIEISDKYKNILGDNIRCSIIIKPTHKSISEDKYYFIKTSPIRFTGCEEFNSMDEILDRYNLKKI